MSNQEIAFAIIIGLISAAGVVVAAYLTMYATRQAAVLAAQGVDNEIRISSAVKIAEFRQAWINTLRDALARFASLGLTLNVNDAREINELQTKIDLLMNREDSRYELLHERMTAFVSASDALQRAICLGDFAIVSQDILKQEWETLKTELRNIPPLNNLSTSQEHAWFV